MRRTHVRGHANILKRLLVHVGGFNLRLLRRTPSSVWGRCGACRALAALTVVVVASGVRRTRDPWIRRPRSHRIAISNYYPLARLKDAFPHGQLDPERLEFQGDLTGDGIIVCPDSTRHQKTLDDRDNSWNQCPAEDRVEYAEADLAHVEAVCA